MEAAMGLMRRIPPKHTETALSALLSLMPHHSSDLLSQVDQPLQVPLSSIFIPFSSIHGMPFNSITIITLSLNRVKDNFGWRNVVSRFAFLTFFYKLLMTKQVLCDAECGKEFILCEYNRDADSYRLIFHNRRCICFVLDSICLVCVVKHVSLCYFIYFCVCVCVVLLDRVAFVSFEAK